MDGDIEIQAMSSLTQALEPLDEGTRARVLAWAAMRFGAAGQNKTSREALVAREPTDPGVFDDFAELFSICDPKTDKERALLAAYWVQVGQNQPNFAAQTLNTILKDLGHGVGHITDALDALKDEKPALLLQLKKSGTTKQARKTYKLTQEGIKRVHQMSGKDK